MWSIVFAVKAAVTLSLLWWLSTKIDFSAMWAQFATGRAGLIVAGTLVLALQPPLGALRWALMLRRFGMRFPALSILRWTYAGAFINQVLPATIGGDGLRAFMAQRADGRLASVLASIVLERVLLLLALVLLVLASAPRLDRLIAPRELAWLAVLLIAGTLAGAAFVLLADRMPARWLRWRAARWLADFSQDCRQLLQSPVLAGGLLALSLLSLLNIMASLTLFVIAFGGQADPLRILWLLPPVIAASNLPISIGGWGTREFAMVAVLGTAGVARETAILASVWLGLAGIVITLPGAFVHFSRRAAGAAVSPDASTKPSAP